jgi:spermidine/putrescine transport system substrate-binding protein
MADRYDHIDLAIARALRDGRLSRRMLLRRGGAGAALFGTSAFLAACGIQPAASPSGSRAPSATPGATGTASATATATASASASATAAASASASASPTESATASPTESPSPTAAASPAGQLVWANWPLYIDTDEEDKSKHPSIEAFKEETGIDVRYSENISDNEEFFGTIQPDLAAGRTPQYDLIVMTDWMIAKMASLGYLEELNVANDVPNFTKNAAAPYRDPWFDKGNRYSVTYQAGITGIGYNIKATGRELTSFEDLLDPKFKGKVGLFSEMRDTMSLALLSLGIDPAQATVEQAQQAQQKLLQAAEGGQFRGFYGNEYTDELVNGNLVATVAWSGDVYQLALYDDPDLRFIIPKEGGMRWSDNLAIPKGAAHPVDAKAMMDYLYDVEVATMLSEWIGYFTPVEGVVDLVLQHSKEAEADDDKEWADQLKVIAETIVPTAEQLAQTHEYKNLTEDEERQWNELFNAVLQG